MSMTAPNSTSIGRKYGSGGGGKKADPEASAGQQGPGLGQVCGQEDDEHDLQELTGLDADRSEVDPQPRAVHLVAEQEGRCQQPDADRRPRVLVVTQDGVVPQAD